MSRPYPLHSPTYALIDARLGAQYMIERATIIGNGAAVADAFLALAAMGFTHVLVRNLVPTQVHALASIARLALVKALVTVGGEQRVDVVS